MKVVPKVAWAEGVLILPQHLQQNDAYHEQVVAARLEALDPCSWGVVALELDEHALGQQRVALRRFEGVLPDGTSLSLGEHAGQQAPPPARGISGHFPTSRTILDVYLALPQERVGLNNYTSAGEPVRYNVASRSVFDQARDDAREDVDLAFPNVALLLGDEAKGAELTVKLAEVERDANGAFTFGKSYVPPCLRFAGAPALRAELKRLLALVVSRHRALSEARRHAGQARIEFSAADVTRFLQLNALGGLLPLINHLIEYGDLPMRSAFLMLAQSVAQLATFAPDVDVTQPFRFDYRDLRGSFAPLFDLLDRLVRMTDTEQYVACPLRLHKQSYIGELTDERIGRCRRYLFAVESPLPRPQVVAEFVGKAKIASHDDIDAVTGQAVRGVPVEECRRPPPQVPVRPGVVYFDVTVGNENVYWKHVWKDSNVVVRLPPLFDPERTQVRLLGLIEAGDAG